MALEGAISVELDVRGERVHSVRVSSSRPLKASRALLGLPVETMLESVPLLFSVCGEAQSMAAREACEQALGLEVGDGRRVARELRVTCEAIDNQALQVALGWPPLFDQPPAVQSLRALREATAKLRALAPPFSASRVSATPSSLEPRVVAALVGARLLELLGPPLPETPAQLGAWASGAGCAQGAVAGLMREGLEAFGRSKVQLLPDVPASWFEEQLAADSAFGWAPRYQGQAAETGAVARLQRTSLISALLDACGTGLLTRFVARIADLEALGSRATALAAALGPLEPVGPPQRRSGRGSAVVETSRGLLAHVVAIEEERVISWQVVAPTEWNFHPEGPLAAGLVGAPAASAQRLATLLVNGLDPCVGFEVRLKSNPA